MYSQSKPLKLYAFFFLVILLLAGMGWVNFWYASQDAGGDSFLISWIGARALITTGDNPYSEEVANEIREALQERPGVTPLFSRIMMPLYGLLLFLPFALFTDAILARTLWMFALEIFLFLLVVACIKLTRWRLRLWSTILYAVFVITWFHSLIVIHTGSMALLVALLLAWSFLAIHNGQDELGGALLALSTLQPLLVLLPIIFVLVWSGAQKRGKLVVWFLGTMLLLVLGSMFFQGNWLLENIRAVFASLRPLYPATPGAAFASWWPGVGSRLGWVLTALLAIILLAEWWMAARSKEFRWFLWTASLTLVFEQWIGIRTTPVNFIVLLIPLTLVFAVWDERWMRNERHARAIVATVASMLLLGLGIWWIYWNAARQGWRLHEMPVLLFPLPLFLIITLYWVRWWAIRPPRLYVEALRDGNVAE